MATTNQDGFTVVQDQPSAATNSDGFPIQGPAPSSAQPAGTGQSLFESIASNPTTPTVGAENPNVNSEGFPIATGVDAHPASAHDESDRFTQDDPDANWLEKAWTFANKPLTESLFGWGQYRSGAGGFERGVEKIASGVSSPLSLLTLAAFAPAGIAESVAGNVLKTGLTEGAEALGGEAVNGIKAAAKVENYIQAVGAAKKAETAGQSIESAVNAATKGNLTYEEFLNYNKYLTDTGLHPTDVLKEGLARRVASSSLQKAGVTPAGAVNIAKGMETAVNAGFAIQQLHGALYAYPRVMDLMSQGDYDGAMEYMVEGGAGAVFGSLGLAHSFTSVHDLIPGLNERRNLPLSDQTTALDNLMNETDGHVNNANVRISAQERDLLRQSYEAVGIPIPQRLLEGDWKDVGGFVPGVAKEFGDTFKEILGLNKDADEKVSDFNRLMYHTVETGGDKTLAHQLGRALIRGFNLEDWADKNLPDYTKPSRTFADIVKEQQNNLLYAKNVFDTAKSKIQGLESDLAGFNKKLNEAGPEEAAPLVESIKQAKSQLDSLQLGLPKLEQEYQSAKEWQKPQKETVRTLLDNMKRGLNEAAENATTPQEFNDKVRALGNYPLDIDVIEKQFPDLKTYTDREYPTQKPVDTTPKVTEEKSPIVDTTTEDSHTIVNMDGKKYATIFRNPTSKRWYERVAGQPDKMLAPGKTEALDALSDRYKNEKEPVPQDWRRKFPPSTVNGGESSAFPMIPWLDGPMHQGLPENILDYVEKARNRSFSEDHIKEMKKQISTLSTIASRDLTPQELSVYRALRKADDDVWTLGYNKGIIGNIVENHIQHIWGEKDGADIGNPAIQHGGTGAFSIDASQARHRSWGTTAHGFLRGYRLKTQDPVSIITRGAFEVAQAAAHKDFLDFLKKSELRDSEGMPIGAFFGRGYEVPGKDGSNSAILVNPNVVRNIQMNPGEVYRLEKAGLLDTYIKDGRVVDRTPSVDASNVQEWIGNTQKKLGELENQNPLLIDPRESARHKASWGQLQDFVKAQSGKIADYLDKVLADIKAKGPIDGKNYAPLDKATKPADIDMVNYLSQVLYGEATRKLSSSDIGRLEKYAERNRLYSEGLSSIGEEGTPIRPSEISRILMQEKNQLVGQKPHLQNYLDYVHSVLGTNGESRKSFNKAIKYVAHAAENGKYDQLTSDLRDLKLVDKLYTSANPLTQKEHAPEVTKILKDINDRQEKSYLWAPKTHIVPDHWGFRGYKWMATAADGTPTLAESDFGISREYYQYVVNRLGIEPSWLRKREGFGKVTAPLLETGAKAKTAILSGSPFHVIQEFLRAIMLWTNPFVRPNPLSDLDEEVNTFRGPKKIMRLGVENHLNIFSNRFEAEDHSVGVASHFAKDSVFRKVPVVNAYLRYSDQVHDFLFKRLIPQYKASGFRKMFDKYAQAHPDWTDDAVAKQAALHVNNAFGGQNWRAMGRASATQDWFHLLALAPDWLESEMRFAAGLFKGVGVGPNKYEPQSGRNFTREQVAGTAIGLWATARVLNMVYSGSPHYETPFGLSTRDKDGREIEISVRTMPTDILHMATDPVGFLKGRLSPFARTAQEAYTGRNEYGQKLTDSEKYVDLISNLVPIWGQAGLKEATHLATSADVGTSEQIIKAAGATAQVYRTPAQKMAANLASERSEEGTMNPAAIAHHRLILQLEDDLRNGRIKTDDLNHMVDYGNLPIADAKAVVKNVKETTGQDPENARLYSRVSRLDWPGAISVWDEANPTEKQLLEKLITKKAKAYLTRTRTTLTPDERNKDPFFKRARQIAPVIESEE